jgi:hypothetical protein
MYSLLSSNYDIPRSRGNATDVLNTYHEWRTIKEKVFFLLLHVYTSVYREIERLWITCFVYNKEFDNFFKRIFLYSHLSYKYIHIFSLYEYILYTCILIYHIYKLISFCSFSPTAQHSTNECKWTSMISDLLPDWILCNHYLLMCCLSDIFYLYIYIYRDDKVKKQFVPHWVFVYVC